MPAIAARCRSAPSSPSDGRDCRPRFQPADPFRRSDRSCRDRGHSRRGSRHRQLPPDRRHAVRDHRAVPDVRGSARPRARRHARVTALRSREPGAVVSTVKPGSCRATTIVSRLSAASAKPNAASWCRRSSASAGMLRRAEPRRYLRVARAPCGRMPRDVSLAGGV